MVAASLARPRRRSLWKAPLALALYAGALYVGWSLVDDALSPSTDAAPAGPASADTADSKLVTHANRASRSVVGVGSVAGFVAWRANGLSLVLTVRPAAGWKTGPARSTAVTLGTNEHAGTLVRADLRTGLGLVRVRGEVAPALWQARGGRSVRRADRLVVAGPGRPHLFSVAEARPSAIWGAGAGTTPGAPVLDSEGRVVGVTTGGRVIPIERACGLIRRC